MNNTGKENMLSIHSRVYYTFCCESHEHEKCNHVSLGVITVDKIKDNIPNTVV